MTSLFKNKFWYILIFMLIDFQTFGQTITQAVMNIDPATSGRTEGCVGVKLVVDYTTSSGGYSVASPTYYVENGHTQILSANVPTNVRNVINAKRLIFYTDSHMITYTIPASGTVSENYDYIESCGIGIPQLFWTLTLGNTTSLITYYIHT